MVQVFCVSDIHTDFPSNMEYIKTLPVVADGILIVCGDISDNINIMESTLSILRTKYPIAVFFTPGNHELWVGRSDNCPDSMGKLEAIYNMCRRIGVYVAPTRINEHLAIFPMLGWHHPSFDEDWEYLQPAEQQEIYENLKPRWGDFRHCKWDIPNTEVAGRFLKVNEALIDGFRRDNASNYPKNVITFTHFVPRRELLPPKKVLIHKFLPMVVGTLELDKQLRRAGSTVHVFGHTHIDYDVVIDNVRYVQNAFATPNEREGWKKATITGPYMPKLIYHD
ncbi:hypothetical protein SAMD00019534_052630, partial [Acytostelium subglobosum LB1]|uniref:hypothetical protein n=1 Tax=Acytostelium subglobosum LB1 TaxID=1410327 RepID=UPI000644D958